MWACYRVQRTVGLKKLKKIRFVFLISNGNNEPMKTERVVEIKVEFLQCCLDRLDTELFFLPTVQLGIHHTQNAGI